MLGASLRRNFTHVHSQIQDDAPEALKLLDTSSDVVLETKVLVSRRLGLEIQSLGLGLEKKVLTAVKTLMVYGFRLIVV